MPTGDDALPCCQFGYGLGFVPKAKQLKDAFETDGKTDTATGIDESAISCNVSEAKEFKEAFKAGGVEACRNLLEKKRDEWRDVPLNVAVIGNSGAGKSSFINAIRRLTADDDGAAAVGSKETTVDVRSYAHPNNPNLLYWDLPGVGTDRFPKKTYLADIKVDGFDFFLLITSNRFTENDTWLGEELYKRNKGYFFIRAKIGADVSSDRKAHPKTHNEKAVVEDIRQSTEEHLKENGCENVKMFLIDNYKLTKFDFKKLESHLIENFPKLKRSALILSLQATSKEVVKLKVAELRSRMWKAAALSGAVAAIPLPGLSVAFDLAVVVKESKFYFVQLGLDKASLERYAKLTSVDCKKLTSIVDKNLFCHVVSVEGIKGLLKQLSKGAVLATSSVIEEGSRFIPLIGSFIAAPLSFAGTYCALKMILDKMEDVSLQVITCAAENADEAEESDDDDECGASLCCLKHSASTKTRG